MARGSRRFRAVLLSLAIVAVVSGFLLSVSILGVPSVERVENRFADVDEERTDIETDLTVRNPNPFGVDLDVSYTIHLNRIRMASGTKRGLDVSPGNTTVEFRTAMSNERIPEWWVSHVRNGEQSTLRIRAKVTSTTLGQSTTYTPVNRSMETDLLSSFNSEETRYVNATIPLIADPILYVNETSATWGSVSERQTLIQTQFVVYNPKSVPYAITEIGYTVTMNDLVMGEGRSDREYVIGPRESETITTVTAIRNEQLDEWWVSHLERNQVTDLRIDFYARLELPGGRTVRIPLESLTHTERIETDIFGTKNETAPPG